MIRELCYICDRTTCFRRVFHSSLGNDDDEDDVHDDADDDDEDDVDDDADDDDDDCKEFKCV